MSGHPLPSPRREARYPEVVERVRALIPDYEDPWAWPTVEVVAGQTGLRPETVRAALNGLAHRQLHRAGWARWAAHRDRPRSPEGGFEP